MQFSDGPTLRLSRESKVLPRVLPTPLRATIEDLTLVAFEYREILAADTIAIECITTISERNRISGNATVYQDPYFVVQLAGGSRGSCFGFPNDVEFDVDRYVGGTAFEALDDDAPDYLIVALLDAIYGEINRIEGLQPSRSISYGGTAAENGALQARVLADLAHVEQGTKVALVGVVEDVVRELLERGAQPYLADLHLTGRTCLGLTINEDASTIIKESSALIMTGNTLKTHTIDALLTLANSRGVRTVVFAMSGAAAAPRYIPLGADAVTTEAFPFFWYPGLGSEIKIWLP